MNCSICGGVLGFENGLYVCSNCGNMQQISAVFENTEVFIYYLESDVQGRRTKDSIIANDLYNKLNSANINTFYQRISASQLTEEHYEKACLEAFNRAKIILITGVSKSSFEVLANNTSYDFSGKTIITVYSCMYAYDLPKQFAGLQAINYDNIGSSSDLIKNALNILGRDSEIDTAKQYSETEAKKKVKIFIISLLVFAFAIYFIFGTPFILKSNKYKYGEKLLKKENYAEAIKVFSSLGDYENSENILKSLYDKYDGYFNNDEGTLYLYLNTDRNLKCEIGVTKIIDDKIVRFNISTVINGNTATFEFTDSQKNVGNGEIKLLNDGIELSVSTDAESELSIGKIDCLFKLESRTDAPVSVPVTKEDLLNWITKKATESDLAQMGIELEVTYDLGTIGTNCQIKGTDIEVVLLNDITKTTKTDEPFVFCVSAPAKLLIPDKSGMTSHLFLEKNVCYMPSSRICEISVGGYDPNHGYNDKGEVVRIHFFHEDMQKNIREDDKVCIISDEIGWYFWGQILEELALSEASKN